MDRPIDEEYDTQMDVERDPCGAWMAIQSLAGENARLCEALDALVTEYCDYAILNKLGDPEEQHNIKLARAAHKTPPDPVRAVRPMVPHVSPATVGSFVPIAPEVGDFTAWVVGMPGPDIDYALCIAREGGKALLRYQVWQQDGMWHEAWVKTVGAHRYGCWATKQMSRIGDNLVAERARLFPDNPPVTKEPTMQIETPLGCWRMGTRLRKTKGASWQGKVVGYYSTSLTDVGYAIESERELGSVQIYPASALEPV